MVAFWSKAVVLRPLSADPRVDVVVDRLSTCAAAGPPTWSWPCGRRPPRRPGRGRPTARCCCSPTACATDSPDPVNAAAALARIPARLQVLALSDEEEAMASCAALAAAGGGKVAALHRPSQAPAAVRELLG